MRHDDFPDDWRALPWFVLRVQPGAEFLAADRVASLGMLTACPRRIEYRRAGGRAKRKIPQVYPLLTGYLFAAVPAARWREVTTLRHVHGVIGVDGRPSRVQVEGRGGLVELCRRSAAGAFSAPEYQRAMMTGREFAVGDRVEIVGAGRGLDGHVVEVAGLRGDVARVVMQMLGASREVRVRVDKLVAA